MWETIIKPLFVVDKDGNYIYNEKSSNNLMLELDSVQFDV